MQKLAAKRHRRAALLAAERKIRFVRDTWPHPVSERAGTTLAGALAAGPSGDRSTGSNPDHDHDHDHAEPTNGAGDGWAHAELARMNRDPVAFLAALATGTGVPHHVAVYHAQELLLGRGPNGRIDPDSATRLCARMLEWAGRFERSRPVGR